jgi:hypothetical protein
MEFNPEKPKQPLDGDKRNEEEKRKREKEGLNAFLATLAAAEKLAESEEPAQEEQLKNIAKEASERYDDKIKDSKDTL